MEWQVIGTYSRSHFTCDEIICHIFTGKIWICRTWINMHFSVVEYENFSAIKEQAFFFKTNKCSWKGVKCAKYKSPRRMENFWKWKGADRGKVRKIKFPQYIINENFEKNKNKFCVFILEFVYFIWFLVYF